MVDDKCQFISPEKALPSILISFCQEVFIVKAVIECLKAQWKLIKDPKDTIEIKMENSNCEL